MEILNQTEIKALCKIVAKSREYHKYNLSRNVSEKTRQTYNKIAERLIFTDQCLPIDCNVSKSSYYVYKAAFISFLLDKISEVVPVLDKLKKSNIDEWHKETHKLSQYLDLIESIGIDTQKSNLQKTIDGNYRSSWNKNHKTTKSTSKNSKSKRLKTLPKNWAEKIFQAAMDSNTPFCDAICLISLCGCRPQEIGYGVSLSLCDDGKIEFSINGAKTNGGLYGQEWRSFSVSSGSAEFVYLVNRLKINNGKMVVQAKPGAICDKVTYLSRKCMPQLKSPVTAYCYRHRFSGILHGLGLDSELISMSLGHCTDVSKAYYSSSSRTGDSGFTISNIKSEKKVKMKNNLKKPWHPSWQAETNPMR